MQRTLVLGLFAITCLTGITYAQSNAAVVNDQIMALEHMNETIGSHLASAKVRQQALQNYLKSIDKTAEAQAFHDDSDKEPHEAQMTFEQAFKTAVEALSTTGTNAPAPPSDMSVSDLQSLLRANKGMVEERYNQLLELDAKNNLQMHYLSSIGKLSDYRAYASDQAEANQQAYQEHVEKNRQEWIASAQEEQKEHKAGMAKLAQEEKAERQAYMQEKWDLQQEIMRNQTERYVARNTHPVYNWNDSRYGDQY